jgi:hypothetical protein
MQMEVKMPTGSKSDDGMVLARGRKALKVEAGALLDSVRVIIDEGREAEFVQACRDANLTLSVPPSTINFLKRFVNSTSPKSTGLVAMSASARRVADCDECR